MYYKAFNSTYMLTYTILPSYISVYYKLATNNCTPRLTQRFYFEGTNIYIQEVLLLIMLSCTSFSFKFPRSLDELNQSSGSGTAGYSRPLLSLLSPRVLSHCIHIFSLLFQYCCYYSVVTVPACCNQMVPSDLMDQQ